MSFKTLKPILILILWASPLVFIDLYSKHWVHQNITDESNEIVITDNIKIGKPHINYWFALNDDEEVPEYKRWFRNMVMFLLAFTCLWGQWQGFYWFDRLPWLLLRGGILGNTIDACFLGGVTDFIHISLSFMNSYYIPNLADFFIIGGLLGLLLVWTLYLIFNYMNISIRRLF